MDLLSELVKQVNISRTIQLQYASVNQSTKHVNTITDSFTIYVVDRVIPSKITDIDSLGWMDASMTSISIILYFMFPLMVQIG